MKPTFLTSLLLSALRWLARLEWWASIWRKERLPADLNAMRTITDWCRSAWTHWRLYYTRQLRLSEAYEDETF